MDQSPTDDTSFGNEAESPRIHFITPFGEFDGVESLPPEVREMVIGMLPSIPLEQRTVFAKALDVDIDSIPDATDEVHGESCTGSDNPYPLIWSIADRAFPNDPHMWAAIQALLFLSKLNPVALSDEQRSGLLDDALTHLQYRAEQLKDQAQTPVDEIVARFRDQMSGL